MFAKLLIKYINILMMFKYIFNNKSVVVRGHNVPQCSVKTFPTHFILWRYNIS